MKTELSQFTFQNKYSFQTPLRKLATTYSSEISERQAQEALIFGCALFVIIEYIQKKFKTIMLTFHSHMNCNIDRANTVTRHKCEEATIKSGN